MSGDLHRQVLVPALKRFWAVALVAALASGLLAAWLVQLGSSVTWTAQATYVVPLATPAPVGAAEEEPVASGPALPQNPVEAQRYAQAFAVLMVEDTDLLTTLSDATGISNRGVAERTGAVPVANSPVLRVDFTADSEEQVQAYFDTLDRALTVAPSVTPNIPAGFLRTLRPATVVEQPGLAPLAPAVGLLVGLLVGLGVAVLLERLDPRVRSAADVRELATWPVLPIGHPEPSELSDEEKVASWSGSRRRDGLSDPHTDVLVQRAVQAAPVVRSVAVLGVRGVPTGTLQELAQRLASAGHGEETRWVAGGQLATDGAAERLAQDSDVVILIAPVHGRLRHLTNAVQALQDLAVEAVLVGLAPRQGRSSSNSHRTGRTNSDTAEAGDSSPTATQAEPSLREQVAGSK